jgi:antitoxin MazE
MKTQVSRWGNSLAVRIPRHIADSANLREGDDLELAVKSGIVTMKPSDKQPRLKDLVAKITPENRHHEIEWGLPQGNEIW